MQIKYETVSEHSQAKTVGHCSTMEMAPRGLLSITDGEKTEEGKRAVEIEMATINLPQT